MTRPIARDSHMSDRRSVRAGYGIVAGLIGLALVAALVVLPVRRWWNQRAALSDRRNELAILQQANERLGNEVEAMQTREGKEAEIRDALGYAYPGEERTRAISEVEAPTVLPPGYPYDVVTAILDLRRDLAGDDAGAGTARPDAGAGTEPTIAPPAGNAVVPAG